ncbi:MAG: hypothetical protein LBR95_06855 [Azoarcus sp.]|jgi:hypothetical protein|nr:hypothetical protein [Azoarcus sp.]
MKADIKKLGLIFLLLVIPLICFPTLPKDLVGLCFELIPYGMTFWVVIKLLPKVHSIRRSLAISVVSPIIGTVSGAFVVEFLWIMLGEKASPLKYPHLTAWYGYLSSWGMFLSFPVFILCYVHLKKAGPDVITAFNRKLPKILAGFAMLMVALWYVIFKWDWVEWIDPSYEGLYCHSPNREYYVLRYQSVFDAIFLKRWHVYGTAKLYSKDGKLLYSERALLSMEYGPYWFGNSVAYFGREPDWYYKTPTPTGEPPHNDAFCDEWKPPSAEEMKGSVSKSENDYRSPLVRP